MLYCKEGLALRVQEFIPYSTIINVSENPWCAWTGSPLLCGLKKKQDAEEDSVEKCILFGYSTVLHGDLRRW